MSDEKIRIRLKVWTSPEGQRYLVPSAFGKSLGRLVAYGLRDQEVRQIELTAEEFNALPFSWFEEQEAGVASPGKRAPDLVTLPDEPDEPSSPDPNQSPAVRRGLELMYVPMGQLPPSALIYAGYACTRVGMCGEVLLTAWCVYAQIVEGLECDDPLYMATPEVRAEWAIAQRDYELVVAEEGRIQVRRRKDASAC